MSACEKRILRGTLCAVLTVVMLGTMATAVAAAGKEGPRPFSSASFAALKDNLSCFYARIVNAFHKTDETAIEQPSPLSEKGQPAPETPAVDPALPVVEAEQWRCVELTFQSAKTYNDPFTDVTLDLLLTGNGKQYTVPCFWDGDGIWKSRVACPAAGTWVYQTVCSNETDSGLHGQTGTVECKPYTGTLDVYSRGFVTTGRGKKYFTYADGTPFFYLGDTHWSLGDETPEMVREIAARRVKQGFTVWQSEPIGEQFDLTDGVTAADLAGFRAYDEKFRLIADAGLTHANAAFFYPSNMTQLIESHGGFTGAAITGSVDGKEDSVNDLADAAKAYLDALSRYWVARYGAYPVMWTLGQEGDNDFYWEHGDHPQWNALNNPYKLVAQYFDKYDMHSHPLTVHQEFAEITAAYGHGNYNTENRSVFAPMAAPSSFRDVPAHTFYAAQWSPSLTESGDRGIEKDYWYNSQGKPAINYEGRYCYLWTKNFGARMQGWTAYLNGMYGYGWGGQDTWSYKNPYGKTDDTDDGVDVITAAEKQACTWRTALEMPSAYQAGYMRQFLEDGKWWDLIPRFDNESWFMPHEGVYSVCAATSDGSERVLYFYSFTDLSVAERPNTTESGGVETGTLGQLKPSTRYDYQWFDPISGEYGESGTFRSTALGTYSLGDKPSATDWAIRITPANKTPLLQSLKDCFLRIGACLKQLFPTREPEKEVDETNLTGGDFYRIFPNMGVCDPHVHIFNGKAYLFSSHDYSPGQPIFRMDDWQIFSSDDLVNWKLETTIHPEDTFLGPCQECYATDAAERNGKYYFYFCQAQYQTGVLVSENGPAGPYKDVLGKPLLPPRVAETPSYDPTVFVDDDENKTPYIMWGYTLNGDHYYIARLNEDMISLAEEPRMVEIEHTWINDACWLTKFDGVYYLNSHEGDYATSDNIYGPYTYRGKIMRDCFTDHGTFFTFHNQTYFTYAVPENYGSGEPLDRYFRTMKIVYAHRKDNGELTSDAFIKKVGVGQYNAMWDEIQAEWFFDASDGIVKKENAEGFELRGIRSGDHVTFPKIHSMPKNATVQLCVSNGNDAPCLVEIRKENEDGEILGSCTVEPTGGFGNYKTFDVQLKNTAGTHGLCFVFRSEAQEALRFDRFSFMQNTEKSIG